MTEMLLKWVSGDEKSPCAFCRVAAGAAGLGLYVEPGNSPVCRECGQDRAPALTALLSLAEVASRVGRIVRHADRGMPLAPLLEIMRASQNYSHVVETPHSHLDERKHEQQ